MALIHAHFFSETIGLSCSMYVILPQTTRTQIGMTGTARPAGQKHPVLYLLHGLSDDHTIWLRRTSIERYVAPLGLAVVMPAVHRSYYTDQVHGHKYFTFVSEEVPAIARQFFPLSDKREDNFVAGLSMGGYGAFKLALTHPERYAAAASLSGAMDFPEIVEQMPERRAEFENTFGPLEKIRGSSNDLHHLLDRVAAGRGPKPKLWQCCGTEDFLIKENRGFRDHAKKLNLDYTYEEGPGIHDWAYWDLNIQRVLNWLPLPPMDRTGLLA